MNHWFTLLGLSFTLIVYAVAMFFMFIYGNTLLMKDKAKQWYEKY